MVGAEVHQRHVRDYDPAALNGVGRVDLSSTERSSGSTPRRICAQDRRCDRSVRADLCALVSSTRLAPKTECPPTDVAPEQPDEQQGGAGYQGCGDHRPSLELSGHEVAHAEREPRESVRSRFLDSNPYSSETRSVGFPGYRKPEQKSDEYEDKCAHSKQAEARHTDSVDRPVQTSRDPCEEESKGDCIDNEEDHRPDHFRHSNVGLPRE